jgi:hypothetical protein
MHVEPHQIRVLSSSNLLYPPQDHLLPVGWIVPIWVLDLDIHIHAHDILNLIWKSDLKFDLSGRMHYLRYPLQQDAQNFLYVFLDMHAGDFLRIIHSFQ